MPRAHRSAVLLVLAFLLTGLCNAADQPIPGQNINMVSGREWPGGDPFLQRQNEPSIAVSTRNPLHLLAGANDYRTVDLPYPDVSPDNAEEGACFDANHNPIKCAEPWLGVFKSFDGGQRWQSVLLAGFPQDNSLEGASSPLKGFSTAADPVVRAGANGMFYYAGMAFHRNVGTGVIFVARFIDLNNKENGDVVQGKDPIRYINTVPVKFGTAASFLDKPWIAVDIPRLGAGTCSLQVPQSGGPQNQTFAGGNVYLVYTQFAGTAANASSKLMFTRSRDCGATWSTPISISGNYLINQGATIQIDPQTGIVYVAWRVFRSGNQPDAIVGVASLDGGRNFTPPLRLVTLPAYNAANPTGPSFFDQGTTFTSIRTNAYPALGVENSQIPFLPGRIYLAWSQRGVGPNGHARIMMMVLPSPSMFTSTGLQLPVPFPIDSGALSDDFGKILNPFGTTQSSGHQFMPQISTAEGKLTVVYYDQRLDHTLGTLFPNFPNKFVPDATGKFYQEGRTEVSESGLLFTPFLDDFALQSQRHTIELRVAQAKFSFFPSFTSARVSTYSWGTLGDGTDVLHQLQLNPPNLPLFRQGTVPFLGDYIDVTGAIFTPSRSGGETVWKFSGPSQSPVHYVAWTSNQDVRPPLPGQTWADYTPPAVGAGTGGGQSVFDPNAQRPACAPGSEGTRNQNIYSSRITRGLLLFSPQNNKPLSATLQRAFVVLAQNFSDAEKSFRLTIANQPVSGKASFLQFPSPPLADPLTTLEVKIAAHSGIARTVFATSSDPHATITVNAVEISGLGGAQVAGGLSSFVVLNADSSNPSLVDPDGAGGLDIATVEIYTPNVSNPNVSNPNVSNPNVSNPNVSNPNVSNPNVSNPNVSNLDIADPNISNPNVSNPNVSNPNVSNPNVSNPNVSNEPVSDATYEVTNNGNTSAAYNIKLVGAAPIPLQLLLSKSYTTPAAQNCHLYEQNQMLLQSNITSQNTVITPNVSNDPVANITNPNISNATIALAPGESAFITIRGNVDKAAMETIATGVTPTVAAQAANSNSETGTPDVAVPLFITTASLPGASGGQAYAATLQATGGQPPYTWELSEGGDTLPAGLNLNSATGEITGTPTQAGTFNLLVEVRDSGDPQRTARRRLTIDVEGGVDIEALAVAPKPETPTPWIVGQNVSIQFDIRNIGTVAMSPATPLVCRLGEATVISTFAFGLEPGSTANMGLNFTVPSGQGTNPLLRCTVTDPADTNSENNSATTNVAVVEGLTFTVTNTEDSGAGSLRQAILDANAHVGPDRIVFAIAGAAPHVITPTSSLPGIDGTTAIDATASGQCDGSAPLVEIDGVSAPGSFGLDVASDLTVIRGLAITRFNSSGHAGIRIAFGLNNVVECNYIGLAPDGVTVKGNFDGVHVGGSGAFNSVVGGTSDSARNVISGNLGDGVLILGPTTQSGSFMNTFVQGNFIGTNATGALNSGNVRNGVHIINSARNTIGGEGMARNVISANSGEGVRIDGAFATENLVQGNYIGITASGLADLGNSASGVYIRRAPGNSVIGNVVSGNDGFAGVAICGDPKFCGGGDFGEQGNNASGNVLKGNFIGTSPPGTAALGNRQRGVSIDGAPNNVVGGAAAGDGNVIAANRLNGVVIFNGADGNLIRGNSIGTDASGTLDLGNTGAGVLIQSGSNNVVSGKDDDRTGGNRIRFNTGAGIAVTGGSGNRLRINRFQSNAGLGIDLGNDGVTPNDTGDPDTGPNGLQNAPVLSTAAVNGGVVNVQGSLNSTPQTTFTIDLYVSNVCNSSDTGEGGQWFGGLTVTTDDQGNANFNGNFGGGVVSPGQIVSAIATSGAVVEGKFGGEGSTSEFSFCALAGLP